MLYLANIYYPVTGNGLLPVIDRRHTTFSAETSHFRIALCLCFKTSLRGVSFPDHSFALFPLNKEERKILYLGHGYVFSSFN